MDALQKYLLWIDGLGGLTVGLVVLLISGWLSALHGLPYGFILFLGAVNMLYGAYSTPLAMRSTRPAALILFLVCANIAWGFASIAFVIWYWDSITVFGIVHILGEGLYVAGLGALEWRWREALQRR